MISFSPSNRLSPRTARIRQQGPQELWLAGLPWKVPNFGAPIRPAVGISLRVELATNPDFEAASMTIHLAPVPVQVDVLALPGSQVATDQVRHPRDVGVDISAWAFERRDEG